MRNVSDWSVRLERKRELARLAGITHMTLWNAEHGYREAHPKTIRKLAAALEVEPKVLLERKEEDGEEARKQ